MGPKRPTALPAPKPTAVAVAAALGTLPLMIGPARAQDGALEEITVTASRRTTSVQDIPFNIAAFSGETLERKRLQDLGEFARWVPGLSLVDQGPRAADLMTVRGLNVSSLNASEFLGNGSGGGGDSVATYVGEIPLYVDLRMNDMERVEVLLGPQGTLYGAGTLAGAIRYIPNKPRLDEYTLDLHGDVYTLAESSGAGFDAGAVVNLPIVDDRLAFRASVGYLDDPGFIDYNFLVREPGVSDPEPDLTDPAAVAANLRREQDADTEETLSARFALLWAPTDSIEATLTYYFQNQDAGARTINHREAFGTGRYESGHRFLEPNERENQLLSLEVSADLGFAELVSATGVARYDEVGQRDQTDLLLNFEYGYEDFPAFAAFTRDTDEQEFITQEIRLVSASDGPLNWIVGLFYSREEQEAVSQEFVPGIPQFFGINRPDNLEYLQLTFDDVEERALFGEIGYQINDAWQVTLGGRFFDFEEEQFIGLDLPLFNSGPDVLDPNFQGNLVDDDGTLFKINSSYNISDDTMVYGTISEGYRIGGVNSIFPCPVPLDPAVQNVCALPNEILIQPDTTTNYEIGLRSSLMNGQIVFNGALFFIDWQDIQVEGVTVNGGIPITKNGGEAESRGVELALQAQISDSLSLQSTYAYTDAELTSLAPGLVDGEDGLSGDRLAGTPEHQASLLLSYFRPLDGGRSLTVDYGITAISDVYTRVGLRSGGEALAGFGVSNLSATLDSGAWSATLYADNLFNKYAETATRQTRDITRAIGPENFQLRRFFKNVIRPRSVGIEFRYSFDFD